MKSLTTGLSHVNRYRLFGPCDYRNQWLEILNGLAQKRLRWCMYIHSLSSLEFFITFYFTEFYFFEPYLRCLTFFITTDTVDTSTILRFNLTISSLSKLGMVT